MMQMVLEQAQRAPGRYVNAALDDNGTAQLQVRPQGHPFYQCKLTPGQPLEALPTLVAYTGSRAFRNGGPGLVFDGATKSWEEPCPDERERIMGHHTGCTRVPGVSHKERHEIMGRAMDRHTTVHLIMAVYMELGGSQQQLNACALYSNSIPVNRKKPRTMQALPNSVLRKGVGARILHAMQTANLPSWQVGMPLLSPNAVDPIRKPIEVQRCNPRQGIG
jgi:hypothetical protein